MACSDAMQKFENTLFTRQENFVHRDAFIPKCMKVSLWKFAVGSIVVVVDKLSPGFKKRFTS